MTAATSYLAVDVTERRKVSNASLSKAFFLFAIYDTFISQNRCSWFGCRKLGSKQQKKKKGGGGRMRMAHKGRKKSRFFSYFLNRELISPQRVLLLMIIIFSYYLNRELISSQSPAINDNAMKF